MTVTAVSNNIPTNIKWAKLLLVQRVIERKLITTRSTRRTRTKMDNKTRVMTLVVEKAEVTGVELTAATWGGLGWGSGWAAVTGDLPETFDADEAESLV